MQYYINYYFDEDVVKQVLIIFVYVGCSSEAPSTQAVVPKELTRSQTRGNNNSWFFHPELDSFYDSSCGASINSFSIRRLFF